MVLKIAEQLGLYDKSHPEHGMKFLEGKEPLSVAVVVLQEEVLVVAGKYAVVELDNGVVVHLPAPALDKCHSQAEALVERSERCAKLVYATIVEYILVLHAVDDRYPELAVDHDLGVNKYATAKCDTIP